MEEPDMLNAFCTTPPRSSLEGNIETSLKNEGFATLKTFFVNP